MRYQILLHGPNSIVCLERFYGIYLDEMLCDLFPGCDHSGVSYKNGDIFSPTGDACDMCTCQVIIISAFEANIV